MLKPEMLEKIIEPQLKGIDDFLWNTFPSQANLSPIVKDIYSIKLKNKSHFIWGTLTLLLAKSINATIPSAVVRIAGIIELMLMGRHLKHESQQAFELFTHRLPPEILPFPEMTPATFGLVGDFLISCSLEKLSSFNIPYFSCGFSLAHQDFLESELLLHVKSKKIFEMSDTEYLALLQLRTRTFAAQVALGISKICHANLEITEGLVSYCQHFAMAITLFQELILLSYETHHAYNLFEILKITC